MNTISFKHIQHSVGKKYMKLVFKQDLVFIFCVVVFFIRRKQLMRKHEIMNKLQLSYQLFEHNFENLLITHTMVTQKKIRIRKKIELKILLMPIRERTTDDSFLRKRTQFNDGN